MEKAIFYTSLGWVGVAATEQGIYRVVLPKKDRKAVEHELNNAGCEEAKNAVKSSPVISRSLDKAVKLLGRYFSGECVLFDLPLDLRYHTPFQQAVWRAAAEIPCGETRSYAWIARRIKSPRASRAVGQALGANPVPVLIP
jgi:methylated-DNA-[protein]-cysteine S-methyltransferase